MYITSNARKTVYVAATKMVAPPVFLPCMIIDSDAEFSKLVSNGFLTFLEKSVAACTVPKIGKLDRYHPLPPPLTAL